MTVPSATSRTNEAAERLRNGIGLTIADDMRSEQDALNHLLDAALSEERRRTVERISGGLGLFLYNRDFHMSHEESVADARAMIDGWLDEIGGAR